jgi:hypothetical protein
MRSSQTRHTHRPVNDSERGATSGGAATHCRKMDGGKMCNVTGAHISCRCRCGATGIMCPSVKHTYWTVEAH